MESDDDSKLNNQIFLDVSNATIFRRGSLKGLNLMSITQSSSFFGQSNKNIKIEVLKPLSECSGDEVLTILLRKIKQCTIMFDFSKANFDLRDKEIKRSTLIELVDFVSENTHILDKTVYYHFLKMIGKNILRILPPKDKNLLQQQQDDDRQIYESSWPHLQIVYDLFLTILELPNFNSKLSSRVIDINFVQQLLELFDSDDPRERDSLKTILHRIYGKFLHYRTHIRQMMNNVFLRFTHMDEVFAGVSELLEIYGSIINGFALPLKEEHTRFLINILLPMHKVSNVMSFHGQLAYCILQFIEKESILVQPIMKALIKYWPKVCSPKEVLFLGELEEIIEVSDIQSLSTIESMAFKQIAKCCCSTNFLVAERALCFWQNDHILKAFGCRGNTLIPLVFPHIYYAATEHWNTTICAIAINVINILIKIDHSLCVQIVKSQLEAIKDERKSIEYSNFMERFTMLRLT